MANVACGKPPDQLSGKPSDQMILKHVGGGDGTGCKDATRRVAHCHDNKKFSSPVLGMLREGAWSRSARKRRLDYRVDCNNQSVRERAAAIRRGVSVS